MMKLPLLLSLLGCLLGSLVQPSTVRAQSDTLFLLSTNKTIDVGSSMFRQLVYASRTAVNVDYKMVLVYELDSARVLDTLSNWVVSSTTGQAVAPLSVPIFSAQRADHLGLGNAMLDALDESSDSVVQLRIYLEDRPDVDGQLGFNFAGINSRGEDRFWDEAARYQLLKQLTQTKDSIEYYEDRLQRTQALKSQTETTLQTYRTKATTLQQAVENQSPTLRDLAAKAHTANDNVNRLLQSPTKLKRPQKKELATYTADRDRYQQAFRDQADAEHKGVLDEQLTLLPLLGAAQQQLQTLGQQYQYEAQRKAALDSEQTRLTTRLKAVEQRLQ